MQTCYPSHEKKRHEVGLLYHKDYNENQIPTKARPIQMNKEMEEFCRKEIQDLLNKKLIRKNSLPWSCFTFYVIKNAILERGTPRLVINYKPLNKALEWIRYPNPNKKDLLQKLCNAKIFSKFNTKSRFWQIQIKEKERYKTAFTIPFGQYEWNVMPFGLKNAPSEF
ncbi:Uncharacterized protein TCM_044215 [Theobroma cacao]|uniref:Reverse transcriptase domain-containing protein n=1 Tax=Theobroma cacao TaxID=3641 RepID=A0A061FWS0_THECC|nr:Uncharacterized protein TCM_044215 [Theobroma cacao]